MAHSSLAFFPRPTFDAFLYASVGTEENGMELSVVSALARFGVDPWQEAARLATLPQELAADGLRLLLDRLPEGRWRPSDTPAIAAHLVTLLPRVVSADLADHPKTTGRQTKSNRPKMTFLLIAVALASVILGLAMHGALTVSDEQAPAVSGALDPRQTR